MPHKRGVESCKFDSRNSEGSCTSSVSLSSPQGCRLEFWEPTLTYQNLLFCRVPINPILGFIIRTYKKVGFGRSRYATYSESPNLEAPGRNSQLFAAQHQAQSLNPKGLGLRVSGLGFRV